MKILMATMSLDIGGAETYIVELCRALTEKGHDVTVVSNGGVYVSVLENCGVRHIQLPLHRKDPASFLTNMRGVEDILNRAAAEGHPYDIVHAHSRIAAYVCGKAAKKCGVHFVTTGHAVFKVTPLYKLISAWGEKQLAVSCDIKEYLIKNYGIFSDSIRITVNGIDTLKFSPGEESTGIAELFGNTEKKYRIVHVSRLDKETVTAAFALIGSMKRICEVFPGATAVIVGAGTAFDDVKKAAEEVNAATGRNTVLLLGSRTDIPEILRGGGVFVGVSRAALEAMATGLPVLLAGAQGMLGVFDEAVLRSALQTNFCCRGCAMIDDNSFTSGLLALLSADNAERDRLGTFGRELVKEYYSTSKMADDAVEMYRSLVAVGEKTENCREVMLNGYYGFDNMGDDSLLGAIIAKLRREQPGIGITVLTHDPSAARLRYSVRAINRLDLPAIRREMRRMGKRGVYICGGGSLFQDATSARSLLYYTRMMKMAHDLGMKVTVHAGGIGPLYRENSRKIAADVLSLCSKISLRDSESLEVLNDLGADIGGERVSVTADAAFGIAPPDPQWIDYLMKRENLDEKPLLLVAVRAWKRAPSDFEETIARSVKQICGKYGMKPVFFPMQKSKDLSLCRRLVNAVGADAVILEGLCASELIGVISRSALVIGMRLHALIYAASVGTPMIAISYDPKVSSLMKGLDLPYMIDADGKDRVLDGDRIVEMADEILRDRETIGKKIIGAAERMKMAARNDRVL